MFERLSIFHTQSFCANGFSQTSVVVLSCRCPKGTSAGVKRDQGLMSLRELKQSGMPEDLLNAVRLESSGYVTSGSMTDAAKRGCPDDSAACVFEFLRDPVESMEEPSSANAAQLSMPVMPKSMASPIRKSTALMDTELPEDS